VPGVSEPAPSRSSFSRRLAHAFADKRHLCVGIDPSSAVLAQWGFSDDAQSAERLSREVIAASAGIAACVKPQIAFFERFGSAGFAALERVLADARQAEVLVIADVKRGDIGTSFDAYADAWLTPGSPLEADAMTVVAYQGFASLKGALERVNEHGKGLFVLAATSNPEAREVQSAIRADGKTVAQAMVDDALAHQSPHDGQVGSVGVVLGATLRLQDFHIDPQRAASVPAMPVLAPGFGAQGAKIEEAHITFGKLSVALLANESRSILSGGAVGLADRVRDRSDAISNAIQ
jgi:orotidine-5'-phosphate decarboxylase